MTARLPLLAVLALLALPAAAQASRAEVSGGVLLVTSQPGEVNKVDLTGSAPDAVDVGEFQQIQAGPGCTQDGFYHAKCAGVTSVDVTLGDMDDRGTLSGVAVPVAFHGEAGNDTLLVYSGGPATLDGGDGADTLQTYGPAATLLGGAGNDALTGSSGNDTLYGGPDADRLDPGAGADGIHGDDGDDTISSQDGVAEDIDCGAGNDNAQSDTIDRPVPAGSCEQGTFQTFQQPPPTTEPPPPRAPAQPEVRVFELQHDPMRLDKSGRLPVWFKCAMAGCHGKVSVSRLFTGYGSGRVYKSKHPAVTRFKVKSTKTFVLRLRLNAPLRSAIRRHRLSTGAFTVVSGAKNRKTRRLLTDGVYCTRKTPCRGGPSAR